MAKDNKKEINNCNSALEYTSKCIKYIKICINSKEFVVNPNKLLQHLLRCAFWTPSNIVLEKDSREQKTHDKLTERLDRQNIALHLFQNSIIRYRKYIKLLKNPYYENDNNEEIQLENFLLKNDIVDELKNIYETYLQNLPKCKSKKSCIENGSKNIDYFTENVNKIF